MYSEITKDKIIDLMAKDNKSPLSMGAARQPKMEFLSSIVSSIELMLNNLYSISEQLIMIKKTTRIAVSDTTYLKFLDKYLYSDLDRYHKNRYFTRRLTLIIDAIDSFDNKYTFIELFDKLAFTGKIRGELYLNLTIDDFTFFMETYYNTGIDHYMETKRYYRLNPPSKVVLIKQKAIVIDADEDVKVETKESHTDKPVVNLKEKIITKTVKVNINKTNEDWGQFNEDLAAINFKEKFLDKNINYQNIKSGEITANETTPANKAKILIKSGTYNLNNLTPQIEVIEDKSKAPTDLINTNWGYVDINQSQSKMEEEFIYIFHIDVLHYCDLKTLNLEEGDLIATDGQYHKEHKHGIVFYRYYEGRIYFIQHEDVLTNYTPNLSRTFTQRLSIDPSKTLYNTNQVHKRLMAV
ncbi:MAG: hypothetical protein DRG78_00045 [Epsilonproteobacteria bacterium]|nr:MAG: hypothetical protein DRG78_00045 [Campylobacterota bacterium]